MWWFTPEEASNWCSSSIFTSYLRSITTTSFGSTCMGSLLAVFVQALRYVENSVRDDRDAISCLQEYMDYFNKWTYIYAGFNGNDYIEAEKKVF